MFCSRCGIEIEDGVRFCSNCGNQIANKQMQGGPASQPTNVHPDNNRADQLATPQHQQVAQQNASLHGTKSDKKMKPLHIILLVVGAIVALALIISSIGNSSDSGSAPNYNGGYNNSSNQSDDNNEGDNFSENDVVGNWKSSMKMSQLFSFLTHLSEDDSSFNMGIDVGDYESDLSVDFYYGFKDDGSYIITYYPNELLDAVEKFYLSYLDTFKGNKEKFLEAFDITDEQVSDRMTQYECETFEDLIEYLKNAVQLKVEIMRQSAPEGLYNVGTMAYKVENNKLLVNIAEKDTGKYVVYQMKNQELLPVSAESNDVALSDEELLEVFGSKLVRTDTDLSSVSSRMNEEIIGTWVTKTGGDSHQLIIYSDFSGSKAALIDGSDRIEAKVKVISEISFSLDGEDLSGYVFEYSDGLLTRFENGEPDGYTYEKQ